MDRVPDGDLSVVIPARDENHRMLQALLFDIKARGWEAILIDDGSTDPIPFAQARHEIPQGYGAAIKTGMHLATRVYVATMDGDGQHSPRDIQRLLEYLFYMNQRYTMVIGDRRLKEPTLKRVVGRKMLNWLASCFAWRWIPDLNSGMRIFLKRVALGYEPILSNGFSFTASLTLAMLADGYAVDWLPIQVAERSYGQTKVKLWNDGWRTLRIICWIGFALRTRTVRAWWRRLKFT